jgi:hypothetical protein
MKNKSIKLFILIFIICITSLFTVEAQSSDFGLWNTLGLEKKWRKWSFELESELRFNNSISQINRWGLQFQVSYKLFKPIETGFSYEYQLFNDVEYSDIQPRQRYSIFLQGKFKMKRISFTIREKVRRTIKDERDRIDEYGNYDTYKINPKYDWCNLLKLSYNIPNFPITPSFSFQSFYQLNNPDENLFDELRYTLAFTYKIKKQHEFEISGIIKQEINVNEPVTTYIMGIGYKFSF